jgi:hypothetical protein
VTPHSDREIQSVNGRLASLENLLEDLVNKQAGRSSNSSPAASSGGPALSTPRDSQPVWHDLEYEGDSSFAAHSKSITQVIEKGLRGVSDTDSSADVAAVISTLRDFLSEKQSVSNSADPSAFRDVVNYPELSNVTLAPMQAVLTLLRYAKSMWSPSCLHPPSHAIARMAQVRAWCFL